MRIPTKTEAAYIAGLVDADGTITLTRKHRNENRRASVSISNTDRNLLSFVRDRLEAGTITKKRTVKEHHTPSFALAFYNRQALTVIRIIIPFLKTYKAERARIIQQNYLRLTPRNGRYTEELLSERKRFEERVLRIKARF